MLSIFIKSEWIPIHTIIGPNKFQKNTLCTEKFADFAKKTQQLKKNAITQQPIKITQLRLKRRQWEH